MHRVTKKELLRKVDYINFKLDAPEFGKGSYQLNQNYGGYVLVLIVNDGHGEREIGYYRKSAREMYFFLDGIIQGIQARENLADILT